ncbi:hypothetical protein EDB82DRAFT_288633 [Fusarium venenatum]|uniref:uncharacterized protein n=1 Tax=Fusarium venenatum TaxID=56646 RepID=UPI001D2DD093|nr:hypothetical protein EDB82DRAFT_288633 [Fusarium venenatum]
MSPDRLPTQTVYDSSGDLTSAHGNATIDQFSPFSLDTQNSFTDDSPTNFVRQPRLTCNWKGCKHKAATQEEHDQHMHRHRTCPKDDCTWESASEEKEKQRHVWTRHKRWAKQTNYPSISGMCCECDKMFTRKDNLKRHVDKYHKG